MKVLMVNYITIGDNCATGQTLKNLFSHMDSVQILQYSLKPGTPLIEDSCGFQTVYNKTNLLNRFIYKYHEKSSALDSKTAKVSCNIIRKAAGYAKKLLLYFHEVIPSKIDNAAKTKIVAFSPDVIYTLGADMNVLRHTLKFSRILNVPVVVHNMDDLYHTKFDGKSLFSKIARKKLQSLYRKNYSRSVKGLAIGPKMAKEYSKVFGIPFAWAMNCVPESQYTCREKTGGHSLLLIFSGGLHGGRVDTLQALAGSLENTDVFLEIYTSSNNCSTYMSLFFRYENTTLHPYVPKDELFYNLSRADILVHVESFEEQYIRYFRLSMSTKLPEYLSIGRPILCIGNPEIATVEYIRETQIGIVAINESEFLTAIQQIRDEKIQKKMCDNIKATFNNNFQTKDMQRIIYETFDINIREFGNR